MRPIARRAGWSLILVVLAGALVPGSGALFSAVADNSASTWTTTSLYSPTNLAGSVQGDTVSLTWNAAQPNNNGNGNGYVISGVNVGTNPATPCPASAASYTTYSGATAALRYSDSSALASRPAGSFACYLVQTGYRPAGPPPWASAPTWTSVDTLPTTKLQVGFVATSLSFANGGYFPAVLEPGDTITITFNQPVNTASVPAQAICVNHTTGAIYLDQPNLAVPCTTSAALGVVTGGSVQSVGADGLYTATYAWSNGNTTLTMTVGAFLAGSPVLLNAGTRTLTPSNTLTTGPSNYPVCSATPPGGACQPTTTTLP